MMLIPDHIETVDEALEIARAGSLGNVLIVSELPGGNVLVLHSKNCGGLNQAEIVWLLERAKAQIVTPGAFQRIEEPRPAGSA